MKKLFTLLLIMLTLLGCQDNIQSSSPAFVGLKNGDFTWKSSSSTLVVDAEDGLTFTGTDGYGILTLTVPEVALGTFVLGKDATALVTYSEGQYMYATNNNGTTSIVHVSDGTITIEELDTVNGTVTGSFYFNAYTSDGERVVNFSKGVIYKLPVTEGTL